MTAVDTRRPRPGERLASWSTTLRVAPTAALVGAVGGTVSWLGSWNPSYWGDEAATVLSAHRPLGSLIAELGRVDAVHGLYYLMMHLWIGAFGTSELSTRAPSAIAVALLIAGTVVLGSRLAGLRYGILAGSVLAILPRTTFLATEARSYALGTAIAVWITVYFVGLLRRGETRRWPWLLLGGTVGLAAYLFLYLVLLVAVYGAVVLCSTHHRSQLGQWVRSAVVGAAVAAPIAALAYSERGQVAYLSGRGYATLVNVVVSQWFGEFRVGGNLVLPALGWVLILLGTVTVLWRTLSRDPAPAVLENRSSDRDVLRLGLAWLILPTALLLLGNQFSPLYNVRYLSFCAPAVALLMALGIVTAARLGAQMLGRLDMGGRLPVPRGLPVSRGLRVPSGLRALGRSDRKEATVVFIVAALAVLTAAAAPGYLAQRGAYAKNGGSDWRQAAAEIQAFAAPGDAIVFDTSTTVWQRPELAWRLYPGQFSAVKAPQVTASAAQGSGIWDTVVPISEVRRELQASTTVWAMELPLGQATPADISQLNELGYRVVDMHLVHRIEIYQLKKAAS